MNCKHVQREMDATFDEGVALGDRAAAHTLHCPACNEYQRALIALDASLRHAPPVEYDSLLVARIQATIARQPQHQPRHWAYPIMAAAAVLVLAGLGRVFDGIPMPRGVDAQAWLPQEAILPEWDFLKQELVGIPVAVASDMEAFAQGAAALWASVNIWQAGSSGGHSPWLWLVFIVCMAAACALDGMEWMSRRINRSGH